METDKKLQIKEFKIDAPSGSYKIAVLDHTSREDKSVLLCLHGFAGAKRSSVIRELSSVMAKSGIGVLTFDWPAHGESTAKDSQLTVENCLRDLDFIVAMLKKEHEKISCFATSFGGYLAMLYERNHPNVFYRTVLRSPALNMGKVFRGLFSDEDFSRMECGELLRIGFNRKMSLGIDFYHDLMRNDAFNIPILNPENILILQGDRDEVVSPEDTRSFAENNGICVEWFKGTDHLYKNTGDLERIVGLTKEFIVDV